jgi:hypothetical protein
MTGQEIIKATDEEIKAWGYEDSKISELRLDAHTRLLELHARALACHCECLGMNAENSHACCIGSQQIPYGDDSYLQVMKKWGIINEKGEPSI